MSVSKTKKDARVKWLIANKHLWTGWPMVHPSLGDLCYKPARYVLYYRFIRELCVQGMKDAGLLSPKTKSLDVNLNTYVHEARKRLGVYN